MSIDFKQEKCQSRASEAEFGLCDKENGLPAHISYDKDEWNATVLNDNRLNVMFTAIDNCIDVYRPDGNMERRCDGMLTYTDHIIFVELKDKGHKWIPGGIEQLEATIAVFNQEALLTIKKRRAVIVNRKHPNFHTIESETKQKFFSKYKVRLHIGGPIKI